MRIYKSETRNWSYFFFRLIYPLINPVRFLQGIYGYVWFTRDLIHYKLKDKKAKLLNRNLFPILDEKISFTPFDAHYFYQQLWTFEGVLKRKPKLHVDIASTYEMSGYLSKIVKTIFLDSRPIKTSLKNLKIVKGDILNLPFQDNSLESLSCLHVAEHIGLGRYGDPIDPEGTKKACRELARVLKLGGMLYFSLPIGKDRICFNAHRVHSPRTILNYFKDLKLVSFSGVDDNEKMHDKASLKKFASVNYGCGMFLFTKKR